MSALKLFHYNSEDQWLEAFYTALDVHSGAVQNYLDADIQVQKCADKWPPLSLVDKLSECFTELGKSLSNLRDIERGYRDWMQRQTG